MLECGRGAGEDETEDTVVRDYRCATLPVVLCHCRRSTIYDSITVGVGAQLHSIWVRSNSPDTREAQSGPPQSCTKWQACTQDGMCDGDGYETEPGIGDCVTETGPAYNCTGFNFCIFERPLNSHLSQTYGTTLLLQLIKQDWRYSTNKITTT